MSDRADIDGGPRGLRARITQGPVLLSLTLGFGQFLGLFRTTAVARYLGTEIQGDAVIIGMITAFFGSVLTFNAAWQLVQSPRHDEPEFIASLQASSLIRGFATTLLIALASTAILFALGRPSLIPPMLLASIVPTIEGFMNLDAWRLIRHRQYRRLASVEIAGPLASLASAVVILMITRSIWAVPVIAVGATGGRVIMSHLVATRLWRPLLHRNDVREIVAFSLPLIPAGILFWVNTQSDKLVMLLSEKVAWMERFDISEFGAYGTVAGIVLLPRGTIVKTMQSVVVPRISSSREDPRRLRRAFNECSFGVFSLALLITTFGALLGKWILGVALGPQFYPGVDVAGILIAAMGLQVMRTYCYNCSTGMGTTVTTLVGNLIRLVGVVLAVAAAWQGLGLRGLAWSVLVAEILAVLASGYWLSRSIPSALPKVAIGTIIVGGAGVAVNLLA